MKDWNATSIQFPVLEDRYCEMLQPSSALGWNGVCMLLWVNPGVLSDWVQTATGCSLTEWATPREEHSSMESEGPDLGKVILWVSCSASCDIRDCRWGIAAYFQPPIWSPWVKWNKGKESKFLVVVWSLNLCHSCVLSPNENVWKCSFSWCIWHFFLVHNMGTYEHLVSPNISQSLSYWHFGIGNPIPYLQVYLICR